MKYIVFKSHTGLLGMKLPHVHGNPRSCEASQEKNWKMTGTRKWQVKEIHRMSLQAVGALTHIAYLYSLAVQTSFQICCILLLPVHPRNTFHGSQRWRCPYSRALDLRDGSQTHCLVLMGMGILLLQSLSSKPC